MKISFHTEGISLRGTEIALYDYAKYNQEILGNQSIIIHNANNPTHPKVLEKFKSQFPVYGYHEFGDAQKHAENQGVDIGYFIKFGENDAKTFKHCKSVIHTVFPQHHREFHGDIYAFVSKWLAKEYSNQKLPHVPHIVEVHPTNENMRKKLGIPEDATVLGCYGGSDSFNLKFVQKVVDEVINTRSDLFFIFMNIDRFINHQRAIFLPGDSEQSVKAEFINTTDGMIHARGIGETFGLACAEFSMKNKPVITYAFSPQRSHIDILGSKGIFYKGHKDLKEILLGFNRTIQHDKGWDAYSTLFNPCVVMKSFKDVFIDTPSNHHKLNDYDKLIVQGYRFKKKIRNLVKKIYL